MLTPETLWITLQSACAVALVVAVLAGCDAAEAQWRKPAWPPNPVTGPGQAGRWLRFVVSLSAFILLYAAVSDRVRW